MATITQSSTDLAGNPIAAIIGDTSTQPTFDMFIPANGKIVIYEDPLIPATGFCVWLDSGSLVSLIPTVVTDLPQDNPEPASNVLVYSGNKVWLSDFPLVLDSGIVVQLDSGALLSMDQRNDDIYSGMTNSRPGNDVHVTDFMATDAYGPYILDAGILFSLEGSGNSLLNVN